MAEQTYSNPRLTSAAETVVRRRASLAAAVENLSDARALWDSLVALAGAERTVEIESFVETVIERGHDLDAATEIVASSVLRDLVVSGADDTWSGRGNDLRRVQADACRDWLRHHSKVVVR